VILISQPVGSLNRDVPVMSKPLVVFLALVLHAVVVPSLLLLTLSPGLCAGRHRQDRDADREDGGRESCD